MHPINTLHFTSKLKSNLTNQKVVVIGLALGAIAMTGGLLVRNYFATRTPKATLIERAKRTKSSSFIFIENGKTLINLNPNNKITESHSITKSIISLGIGILLDQGKIASVDQPLSEWYPEWAEGPKAKITIRHLLTHTSGLQAGDSGQEIYRENDCLKLALSADLVSEPGTAFFYNNKAVNLLSGIIERVTAQRADVWVQDNLFNPLNIREISWDLDKGGHVYAHAGLKIQAADLAKLGQLILNQGIYNDTRVISQKWLGESMQIQTPHSSCGLLWWIWERPVKACAAIGYRGQYLFVIPQSNIIVVRQTEETNNSASSFDELPELIFKYCKYKNIL